MKSIYRKTAYLSIFLTLFVDLAIYQHLGWNTADTSLPLFYRLSPTFYISFLTIILFLYNRQTRRYRIKREMIALLVCVAIGCIMLVRGRLPVLINMCIAFILPLTISVCIKLLNKKRNRDSIYIMVKWFFLIECILAITERLLLFNFFPTIYLSGISSDLNEIIDKEMIFGFRSMSLHGHPLTNALVVDILMSYILITKKIKTRDKNLLFVLGYIAVLCFNARSSIMFMPIVYGLYLLKVFLSSRFSTGSKILYISLAGIGTAIAYALIFDYGFGGRMLLSEVMDGSAQARVDIWQAVFLLSPEELLFGGDLGKFSALAQIFGQGHVENWLIIFIVYYGIVLFVILFCLMCWVVYRYLKKMNRYDLFIVLLTFFVIASTNNSIAVGAPGIQFLILGATAFLPDRKRKIHNMSLQHY